MRSRRMRGLVITWMLVAMGVGGSSPSAAEAPKANGLVVFVNAEVPEQSLTVEDVRQIFLRQKITWSDGRRIACIDATFDSQAREAFRARVLKMSQDQEKRYWEEQHIKGEAPAPPTFSDTVRAVFMLKGGIGYALRKDIKGRTVKIVLEL